MSFQVYVHLDDSWRVLYVGQTAHLERRTADHRAVSPWWPRVARVLVDSDHPARADARQRERKLVQVQRPPYNVQLNPAAISRRPRPCERTDWPAGLLDLSGASQYCGRSGSTLSQAARAGELYGEKLGAVGYWSFTRPDLDAWMRGESAQASA